MHEKVDIMLTDYHIKKIPVHNILLSKIPELLVPPLSFLTKNSIKIFLDIENAIGQPLRHRSFSDGIFYLIYTSRIFASAMSFK